MPKVGIEHTQVNRRRDKFLYALLFCVIGIAINALGAQIAAAFNLPLYLDCIGTILAGALCGYVPGIIVGYFTNIITSIYDSASIYYGLTSVLIAVCAAWMGQRGWFRSVKGVIGAILVFSLIGGGIGSVLTYCLYGFSFGEGITAPYANTLYAMGLPVFWAQLTADFLLDMLDKAVEVLIALLFLRLLPSWFAESFDFSIWMQRPLSAEERTASLSTKSRGVGLRTKIVTVLSVVMVIAAVVTTGISYKMYRDADVDEQSKVGYNVTSLAAAVVDADAVSTYLDQGEAAAGYAETEANLESIRNSFSDIEYLYVYQIREDGCHVVFDLDTDGVEGSEPGTLIPFDESFAEYVPALLAGQAIDPIITDDTYGWLLTAYQPIFDSTGTCVAYACADISMEHLIAEETGFIARIVSLFIAFFVLVLVITIWLAEYGIILPINSIARAASEFDYKNEELRESSINEIKDLHIRTGDEIENLYHAAKQESVDMVDYFAEQEKQAATIERMQNSLISIMADLVESRDMYTGNHIRNTTAYVRILVKQMQQDGVYADEIDDKFIASMEHSAPLHDIGKITVSDMILNKPGRLTDEEFEAMKQHTVAGKEIIEGAMDAVSDSDYLDEAHNLAAYHHEKWNGQGYPYGLAGKDIPLSARIMAVADVFDALVSKRSYKERVPVDKALDIIREGSGSHFDPVVVESFLRAEDEVRRVAEEQSGADLNVNATDENPEG